MSTANEETTSALRVRGLRKRLGQCVAVDGVDLQLERGEIVGLLGANGAGKTTLLHLCAGLLAPDEGCVSIAGLDPQRAEGRRKLGFAPQATAVYDDLTVEENLDFFARLHGMRGPGLAAAVASGLGAALLEGRRAARTSTLSGGMRRRLHVATALVHAPLLVLLDEPTVGVDAESRMHILDTVEQASRQGAAIPYATHHLDELARLCSRVVVLASGRVVSVEVGADVAALQRVVESLAQEHS